MTKKKTYIILISSNVILILFTLFISLYNGTKQIQHEINSAFKEAIDKNYNNRLLYISYARPESLRYDIMRYIITPAEKGKVKRFVLKSKKGNTIITLKDSLDKETGKRMINEYLFSEIYPVKADEINALFEEMLSKYKITGRTGTVYYSKSIPHYSQNDSIIPTSAYSTPRYTLDITGEIKVQAWIDYNFIAIIRQINHITWFFIGLLIVTSALIFFYYKKSDTKKDNQGLSPSSKDLEIDLEKLELCINGVSCNIQKLDLMLLEVFYRNTGKCVNREDIKQNFWPTDDNANEKIDTHIKAIRKILKDFPEYQLVTVRGKGYYLDITNR